MFRLWLQDRSLITNFPLVLAFALAPIVLVMAGFEVQARVAHRTNRTLTLELKRITISPAKYNRIAWNQIMAWRLEPLANASDLSKLTVEYSPGKKGSVRREWSMVLHSPDQQHALVSELEHFRQRGLNTAPVIPAAEPISPKVSGRGPWHGMIAMALAFWCLMHGVPLLGVGLLPPDRPPHKSESDSSFTSEEKAKLGRTVARHFSSIHQFRRFLLVSGGGLTALGAGLYFWSLRSFKRQGGLAARFQSCSEGAAVASD